MDEWKRLMYICPLCGSKNIAYGPEVMDWLCRDCRYSFATPNRLLVPITLGPPQKGGEK